MEATDRSIQHLVVSLVAIHDDVQDMLKTKKYTEPELKRLIGKLESNRDYLTDTIVKLKDELGEDEELTEEMGLISDDE